MPLLSTFGAASARGFGNLSGIILPSDSLWNTVSFLSHFDGTNNGVNNAFDDSSASNHTITANGNVTQGSFGPFARPDGEWANYFGADNQYLSIPSNDNLNLGSGDFTFDFWIWLAYDTTTGTAPAIAGKRSPSSFDNSWRIGAPTSGTYANKIELGLAVSTGTQAYVATPTVAKETWTHIAIVRSSGVLRAYANGISGDPVNNTMDVASTFVYEIGRQLGTDYDIKGYLSNFRYVKGTAVYSGSSFTPPTEPLTAITNTSLLTCQSNRFVDNSSTGHTITNNGAVVSAFGPFLTSEVYDPAVNAASAYFDGTGDSLSTASSADFALGTGDFTVAFWVYQKEVKDYTIYFDYRSTNSQATLYLYQAANGAFDLYISGTSHAFTPPSMLNRWAYIAISRASSTTKLFVDGVQYLSFSDSTNYVQGSTFYVSRFWQSNSYHVNGYMCDFRWVKGTAVYTSAFTPPTAPLTAITNTKLLLNMADGQAIDSAAQSNLILEGNAKTSTAQAKFGGTSLALDGTDDYATFNKITLSGDFTIEAYAYASNIDTEQCLLGELTDTRTQVFRINHIQADSILVFGSGSYIFGGTNNLNSALNGINSNTWFHMAVTRQSGVCRLFVNGALKDTNNSDTNSLILNVIGNKGDGTQDWNGYADELRISNGVARYTSAFTPPTEPFADKGQ